MMIGAYAIQEPPLLCGLYQSVAQCPDCGDHVLLDALELGFGEPVVGGIRGIPIVCHGWCCSLCI